MLPAGRCKVPQPVLELLRFLQMCRIPFKGGGAFRMLRSR
jgi:hypothetical protein